MKEALSQADFVQENGPERPEFKIKLFADMDDATPATRSSPRAPRGSR
jgi:3-hydroxyacyl-CoA dehydrogenase